jgi:hypothetical protein
MLIPDMTTTTDTIQKSVIATRPQRYVGEVVYMYAFDVAYEMTRYPVRELLGQPVAEYVVDGSKRNRGHLFFYRPQMVRLPAQETAWSSRSSARRIRSEVASESARSALPCVCRLRCNTLGPRRLSRPAIQQRRPE